MKRQKPPSATLPLTFQDNSQSSKIEQALEAGKDQYVEALSIVRIVLKLQEISGFSSSK